MALLGCGFETKLPEVHDAAPPTGTLVLAQPNQFGQATLRDFVDDGFGNLTPRPFLRGGLLATGYLGAPLVDDGAKTRAAIEARRHALSPTGRGLVGTLDNYWWGARPRGIGIMQNDDFSVVYEGELFLRAGKHELGLTADDHALIELTVGETSVAQHLRYQDRAVTLGVVAPADGWYPIFLAASELGGDAYVAVKLDNEAVPPTALRASLAGVSGVWNWNYNPQSVVPMDFNQNLGARLRTLAEERHPGPDTAEFTSNVQFLTMRTLGQFYVPTAGAYQLGVAASFGEAFRLWIDGRLQGEQWVNSSVAPTLELGWGWHDVTVDMMADGRQQGMASELRLQLVATPDSNEVRGVEAGALRPVQRLQRATHWPGSLWMAMGTSKQLTFNFGLARDAHVEAYDLTWVGSGTGMLSLTLSAGAETWDLGTAPATHPARQLHREIAPLAASAWTLKGAASGGDAGLNTPVLGAIPIS